MTKLTPIKKVQEDIWVECKRIIRARYENTCYTCGGKNLKGVNWHTGHLIAKKYLKNYLKYDLRLLRPQCFYCNMKLGGMGALFLTNMINIEGADYCKGILDDLEKEIEPKWVLAFYKEKLEHLKLVK